jgi:hypothetical protein
MDSAKKYIKVIKRKMKKNIYFVNYASGPYEEIQKKNNRYIKKFSGCSDIFSYNKKKLEEENIDFCKENEIILKQKRGDGYWLWKPFVILETLKKIPENSFLIYYDCGLGLRYRVFTGCNDYTRWITEKGVSFIPGINIPEHGIHTKWCKPSVLEAILAPEKRLSTRPQIQATFSIWKNDKQSRKFVGEWLAICKDQYFIDDSINVYDNARHAEFIEHRHDQAILTCLCIKYDIQTINDENEKIKFNKSISFVEIYLRGKRNKLYNYLYLIISWVIVKLRKR